MGQEQSSQVKRYQNASHGYRPDDSKNGVHVTLVNPEVHVHNNVPNQLGHTGTLTTVYSSATQAQQIRRLERENREKDEQIRHREKIILKEKQRGDNNVNLLRKQTDVIVNEKLAKQALEQEALAKNMALLEMNRISREKERKLKEQQETIRFQKQKLEEEKKRKDADLLRKQTEILVNEKLAKQALEQESIAKKKALLEMERVTREKDRKLKEQEEIIRMQKQKLEAQKAITAIALGNVVKTDVAKKLEGNPNKPFNHQYKFNNHSSSNVQTKLGNLQSDDRKTKPCEWKNKNRCNSYNKNNAGQGFNHQKPVTNLGRTQTVKFDDRQSFNERNVQDNTRGMLNDLGSLSQPPLPNMNYPPPLLQNNHQFGQPNRQQLQANLQFPHFNSRNEHNNMPAPQPLFPNMNQPALQNMNYNQPPPLLQNNYGFGQPLQGNFQFPHFNEPRHSNQQMKPNPHHNDNTSKSNQNKRFDNFNHRDYASSKVFDFNKVNQGQSENGNHDQKEQLHTDDDTTSNVALSKSKAAQRRRLRKVNKEQNQNVVKNDFHKSKSDQISDTVGNFDEASGTGDNKNEQIQNYGATKSNKGKTRMGHLNQNFVKKASCDQAITTDDNDKANQNGIEIDSKKDDDISTASASKTTRRRRVNRANKETRMLGQFQCSKCSKTWISATAYSGVVQKCSKCRIDVEPIQLESMKKHREDLCGKCKELGHNCRESIPKKRSNEVQRKEKYVKEDIETLMIRQPSLNI